MPIADGDVDGLSDPVDLRRRRRVGRVASAPWARHPIDGAAEASDLAAPRPGAGHGVAHGHLRHVVEPIDPSRRVEPGAAPHAARSRAVRTPADEIPGLTTSAPAVPPHEELGRIRQPFDFFPRPLTRCVAGMAAHPSVDDAAIAGDARGPSQLLDLGLVRPEDASVVQ